MFVVPDECIRIEPEYFIAAKTSQALSIVNFLLLFDLFGAYFYVIHLVHAHLFGFTWYLLNCFLRYLDQEKGKGRMLSVFESSRHLLLPVLSFKGRGSPLGGLPKDTTSEFVGFSRCPFNAERQAGKL